MILISDYQRFNSFLQPLNWSPNVSELSLMVSMSLVITSTPITTVAWKLALGAGFFMLSA